MYMTQIILRIFNSELFTYAVDGQFVAWKCRVIPDSGMCTGTWIQVENGRKCILELDFLYISQDL